jgi:hypothetical protein
VKEPATIAQPPQPLPGFEERFLGGLPQAQADAVRQLCLDTLTDPQAYYRWRAQVRGAAVRAVASQRKDNSK